MGTRRAFVLVAAFVVLAYAGPSTAAPITVGYSGVIDSVDDPNNVVSGIGVGIFGVCKEKLVHLVVTCTPSVIAGTLPWVQNIHAFRISEI